jgi:hypothetical protein
VTAWVWRLSLVQKDILSLPSSLRAIIRCYLERVPIVWDWDTLGAWKQRTVMAEGVLRHLTRVSGWKTATKEGCGEGIRFNVIP